MMMIIISLCWMSYVIKNQPFEDKSLNFLEIFNEVVILVCLYHLLMFTQGINSNVVMLYNVGWSMDILLILMFMLNIASLGYNFSLKIKAILVRTKLMLAERY